MNDGLYSVERFIKKQNSVLTEFPVIVVNVLSGRHNNRCFHEHNTMELAIITEGNGLHIFNGNEAPIRKGDVLLIPPHVIHAYENGDLPLGVMNIIFDGAKLPVPVLDGEEIPLFSFFFPVHKNEMLEYTADPIMHIKEEEALQDVIRLCENLHDELTSLRPGNVFSCLVFFLNIVIILLRKTTPMLQVPNAKPFKIGDTLKYLDDHFTEPLSLEKIAQKSFMSIRSFQKKFKQATGYTATDYIIRKRISLAKLLLGKSNDRIMDVAGKCGFCDANYFARMFRRLEHMTPVQFRNKAQEHKSPVVNGDADWP